LDRKIVHENILVLPPATVSMFKTYIDHIEEYITQNQIQFIVIDSIVALHKSEYFGRGALAPRQQSLNSIMSKLIRVAVYYNIGVVITNHIIANPDPYSPGTEIAAGGNSIAHFSTHRIYLQKKGIKKPYTAATIIDSPRMPKNQTLFELKPEGVIWKDPKEA
jgi:DNA repair protein RadA